MSVIIYFIGELSIVIIYLVGFVWPSQCRIRHTVSWFYWIITTNKYKLWLLFVWANTTKDDYNRNLKPELETAARRETHVAPLHLKLKNK